MHHIDFLNDNLVDLPKTRAGDYLAFMDDLFRRYIRHVQAVDRRTPLGVMIATRLGGIQVACDALMRSLRAVLSGDRPTAYNELDVALTGLGPHFDAMCPKGDMSTLVNPIYRFRSLGDKPFLRKDLFHIPFHLPNLIKEMRYSVAGFVSKDRQSSSGDSDNVANKGIKTVSRPDGHGCVVPESNVWKCQGRAVNLTNSVRLMVLGRYAPKSTSARAALFDVSDPQSSIRSSGLASRVYRLKWTIPAMTTKRTRMLISATALLIPSFLSQPAWSAPTGELNSPPSEVLSQGAAASSTAQDAASSPEQVSSVKQDYVGANQCFICHRPQTNTWYETTHSHPFTEVPQKYESDPDCLKCHVTGFSKDGGFVAGTTKDLAMVGCESCHGPGALHIDAAQRFVLASPGEEERIAQEMKDTIVRIPSDGTCATCHQLHADHPAYEGQPPTQTFAGSSFGCNPALAVARRSAWTTATAHSGTSYSIKTCGGCHYDQYKQWTAGQHSALSTVLPAKYVDDNSCLACHPSANLASTTSVPTAGSLGVGAACETCHGPGRDHINFVKQFIAGPPLGLRLERAARAAIQNGKPESTCIQCHLEVSHKAHPDFEKQ